MQKKSLYFLLLTAFSLPSVCSAATAEADEQEDQAAQEQRQESATLTQKPSGESALCDPTQTFCGF